MWAECIEVLESFTVQILWQMALLHERNACLVVLGKVFEGVVIKLVKVAVVTVGLLLVVEKTVDVPVIIV